MKKLLFCILCCSSIKVRAAENLRPTVPSCNQRTVIATFQDTNDIVGFVITVGMRKEAIEKTILGRFQTHSEDEKKFIILTPTGDQLPKTITPHYLNTHYPNSKNIELQVFFEQ